MGCSAKRGIPFAYQRHMKKEDLFDMVNICRTLFESGVEKSSSLIRLV